MRTRIGRRLVRLVRAPFTKEIHCRIPRVIRRAPGLILAPKTLLAGPRFPQGPVDCEVLGRQQAPATGLRDDIFEEGPGNVTGNRCFGDR